MKRRSAFGWLDLVKGILLIAVGAVVLLNPHLVLSGLIALVGLAAVIFGVFEIFLYVNLCRRWGARSKASLVTGTVSVIAGILLLLNPVTGGRVLGVIFPIWFIAHFISRIADYAIMRHIMGRAASTLLLSVDIIGLLVSILMIFNSVLFTMTLGGLVAVNLMILGVGSIIEAASNMGAANIR